MGTDRRRAPTQAGAQMRGRSPIRRRRHGDLEHDDADAQPLAPQHRAVLDLQRTAGNRAVVEMLRRNVDPTKTKAGGPTTLAKADPRLEPALRGEPKALHELAVLFGDWESAEKQLRMGTGFAQQLPKKDRTRLWEALVRHRRTIAAMLGLQNAQLLGSASAKPTSDMDLNVGGQSPGEQLIKTREQMDQLFPGWEKTYKMGLVVSAARLTSLADELGKAQGATAGLQPGDADRLLAENAALAERLLMERRLRNLDPVRREQALADIGNEHQREYLRQRAAMSADDIRIEQNEALRNADVLAAELATETDATKRIQLARMVSAAQMKANALSGDMYVTMQAGLDLDPSKKGSSINFRHAYLSTIDQIDMLQHLVHEHGGIGPAAQRYEVAKYASRILDNLSRAGIVDPRIDALAARANHVYHVDREANAAGPGVFGVREYQELSALVDLHLPTLRNVAHLGGPQPAGATEPVRQLPAPTAVDVVHLPAVSTSKKTRGFLDDGKAGIKHTSTTVGGGGGTTSSSTSAAFVSGGVSAAWSNETTAPDGSTAKKKEISGKVTKDGVDLTYNGKTVSIKKDEIGAGFEKGLGDKWKVGVSFSVKSGVSTEQLDARFAEGAAGVLASMLPIADKADDPTNIRSIADTQGYKIGGSVGYDKGPFGASVEGSVEDYDTTRFFTTEKAAGVRPDETDLERELRERAALSGRISGVKGIGDVDIDKLQKGEGYSFEHKGAKSVAGSVTVYGVNAGLGYSDAGFEQTALAKTGDSSFRVTMTATSNEETSGHIGVKGLSLAGSSGTGTDAAVSFSADGPNGVAALKSFQLTGLLPGAEGVVAKRDPEAYQAFVNARAVLENAVRTGVPFTIDAAKREVFAKSKELNRLFMDSNGWSLPEATIPGVTYDEHTTGRSSSDSVGLKVGPLDLMHTVSERLWATQYRTGEGAKTELGGSQSVSNVFSPDESEQSVTDPKGNQGAAWVLSAEETLGEESRQRVARTGKGFMAAPEKVQKAWVEGTYRDAAKNQLVVAFTEEQLGAMRDRIATMRPSDAEDFADDLVSMRTLADRFKTIQSFNISGSGGVILPWMKQLDELEAAARSARLRQMATGDSSAAARGGMFGNTKVTAKQLSEEFDTLTREERKLIVVSAALSGVQGAYGMGFNALRLVLRVTDRAERDDLLREVFMVVARRDDDANAPQELLAYLEGAAGRQGVTRDELNTIVGNTQVATLDTGPTENLKAWRKELRLKGVEAADAWAAKKISEVSFVPGDRWVGLGQSMAEDTYTALGQNEGDLDIHRADRIADLFEGLAAAGGPAGLEKALTKAMSGDPILLYRLKAMLAKDPPRLALVQDLLKSTKVHLP